MTAEEIVPQLKKMGSEGTARALRNHGAHDPCLGVKIGDMKPLQKQLKNNYSLFAGIYDTGIYDAIVNAGPNVQAVVFDVFLDRHDYYVRRPKSGHQSSLTFHIRREFRSQCRR